MQSTPRDDAERQRQIQQIIEIIESSDRGVHDDLPCPECGRDAAYVRYTNPREEEYRTWLRCRACSFESRVHCIDSPAGFSSELVDPALEEYDRRILGSVDWVTESRPGILGRLRRWWCRFKIG